MPSANLRCTIIIPEGQVYDGEADFVVVPAHDGEMGFLRNRAPLVCQLGVGSLRTRTGEAEESWFVDGGFAEVLDNHVVVLTQEALRPEEIDRDEAHALLDAAQRMQAIDDAGARRKDRAMTRARARLRMIR